MRLSACILLVLICFGCRSTKAVQSARCEVQSDLAYDIQTDVETFGKLDMLSFTLSELLSSDSLAVRETIVALSKPDSTGQQHPTKISSRELSKTSETKETKASMVDSVATLDMAAQISDRRKEKASAKVAQKQSEALVLGWKYCMVIGFVVVLGGVFIFRRFKRTSLPGGILGRILKNIGI